MSKRPNLLTAALSHAAASRLLGRIQMYRIHLAAGLISIGLYILPLLLQGQRYYMHLFILICMFTALSMSYNLLYGYLGLLSFAHGGFLGIGAYTAAILSRDLDTGLPMALAAAIATSALVAFLLGIPALRLARTSFVMVTLALFLSLWVISINWTSLTNGALGISAIQSGRVDLPGGETFFFDSRLKNSYLFLSYAFVVVLVVIRTVRSRIGRVIMAIREDEILAQAVGINIFKYKLITFVIGSAMAGGLGALYAQYITYVGPTIFDHYWNIRMLLIVIAGGRGTIFGVLIGAVFFTLMPEFLRIASSLRELMFGITFTLAVLLVPKGIAAFVKDVGGRLRSGQQSDAA